MSPTRGDVMLVTSSLDGKGGGGFGVLTSIPGGGGNGALESVVVVSSLGYGTAC